MALEVDGRVSPAGGFGARETAPFVRTPAGQPGRKLPTLINQIALLLHGPTR